MKSHPNRLGPYLISKPLGKGGMGAVYAAVHETDGQRVAVKMLAPELARSEGFRERFEAEIESLRTLRHPNIVRLFGYGEEDNKLYYSMELVDGVSIEEELQAGRRFDWREVARIAIMVSRALKHAHDHGIIHRDIKPANILLEGEKVKLADFGIAQLFGGAKLTTARGVVGTADYMSPEQADSRPVTDRCDQYSLGCVMYTLLAGRPPFRARSLPEMLQLQRYAEPEPISRFAPDTPKQLERAVSQLLEKSPKERFPNALALAKHLEAMSLAYSRPKVLESDFRLKDHEEQPSVIQPADLAETPAMADPPHDSIHEYETLEAAQPPDSQDSSVVEAPAEDASAPPTRRFVRVIDDAHSEGADRQFLQWLWQGAMLLVLLGVVAMVAARVLRPTSPDRLFDRITQAAEQGDSALLAARADVDEFLERFPDDPRKQQVEALLGGIAFAEAERRIQVMLHRKSQSDSPVESIYLAAMRDAKDHPERALRKLHSLVDLIRAEDPTDELTQVMLPIAQRQAEQLEERIAKLAKEQQPFLSERLEKAQSLAEGDPDAARSICRAIVDLYGDRNWARSHVEQAERLLSRLDATR